MIWQPEFTDKTLSRKPGAVQYAVLKTFRVFARAVNPLGHTIGIAQNVKAVNVQTAIAAVRSESSEYGLSQVIISAVYELKEVH
ncbi:hypothetical protein SK73_01606 [Escherichia coli]|nr:hypothetical protein A1SK_04037 [Escherichia coli KTE56]KLX35332.1 hypothetical protein SK73_01606 [Escherichia coli]